MPARTLLVTAAALALLAACRPARPALGGGAGGDFQIPVEHYKLPNGLRVVLSQDQSAPTETVAVYYRIGFRIEPRDRTGFAHLFEHMMFQGSKNLGKMEFIRLVQQQGGVLNGSTRFDFTNYFEILPSTALEVALWAEADRMAGLAVTQENLTNQQKVVANEVKVNVLNRPYGGFPWLDLPQLANQNWYNAHNFYGELKDLEAATLEDVQKFFDTYYTPSNAVLVIVGDFEPALARRLVDKYFAGLPRRPVPVLPDVSEPRQTAEKRASRVDPKATRPALGVGYHVPPRNTREHAAFVLLDEILLHGEDSLFYEELVQRRGLVGEIRGGINLLGNAWNYSGPMLWIWSVFHDRNVAADAIVEAAERVLERLRTAPVDAATLARGLVKARSRLYDQLTHMSGFGRADLLASFALFDDDPARVNRIEAELRQVTPELLLETARAYLRPTNRSVFRLEPAAKGGGR